jgi:hypothetical protein
MKQTMALKVCKSETFFKSYVLLLLSLVFVYFLSTNNSFAQKNVFSAQEIINSLEKTKAERLQAYMQDLQTTVYAEDGKINIIGDGAPTYIKTDIATIKSLAVSNPKFSTVEFMEVRLKNKGDESNLTLDANVFKNFPNLRHLLVRAEYNIDKQKLEALFSYTEKYGILPMYEIFILE